MSSVTTAKVDSINGTTDLTLTTGNTSGPKIIVKSEGNTGVVLGPNSTVNSFIVNTSGIHVSSNLNIATGSVVGNITFSNSATFTTFMHSATLLTTGQANLNSLRVEGISNAVGAFAMSNTLSVNGDVAFTKNLAVTGVSTFSSNISVTGRLSTTTNVITNTVIANTLSVVNGSVSTNTFTLGASDLTAGHGYARLPNGLLMQWGANTGTVNNATTATVSFPATFTTLYSVQVTIANSQSTATALAGVVNASSTSSFTWKSTLASTAASSRIFWMAIGT
jgi:hypothetical protein